MNIDWGQNDAASVDDILEEASRLTLRDFEDQGFSNLKSASMGEETFLGKTGVYARRLFPTKLEIASRYPVPADSFRVYLQYPAWWAFVLQRVWRNMTRTDKPGLRDEANNLRQLQSWLEK
jgi:hypothetical protein